MALPPDSSPSVATPAPPRAASYTHESGVKETIESILVAFVLAFIFRGFVVEAFVIPTGSMAPTLYGAHMRLHCPDCGYTWDANYRATRSGDDTEIPSSAVRNIRYHCPNCGYAIPQSPRVTRPPYRADDQAVRFGDRILVLKYLYLFQPPTRWDVVVFKSPSEDSRRDATDPEYAQNYIKRLVGLPGESVVILDGSVYTGPEGADLKLASDGRVSGADQFFIQRRPTFAQERLWRLINDNDRLPHLNRADDPSQDNWHQPWATAAAQSGWHTTDRDGRPSRVFAFDNDSGSGALQFDADANPETHALTDWLAYDEAEHAEPQNWNPAAVGDLKLSCFYTRRSGDGPVQLQLTKRDDAFTARFSRGKVALFHGKLTQADPTHITGDRMVGSEVAVSELDGGRPVELEISNVDYRVTVRVNGKVRIQTSDADYRPDVAALFREASQPDAGTWRPQVRIIAEHGAGTIEHLSLWRNIYYLNSANLAWGIPKKIMHLGKKEYFVLGDNSFISGDARYWRAPVELPEEGLSYVEGGRVPGEFMLGKAFFVYWPAGFPPAWFVPLNIVPDFGEMRFIH